MHHKPRPAAEPWVGDPRVQPFTPLKTVVAIMTTEHCVLDTFFTHGMVELLEAGPRDLENTVSRVASVPHDVALVRARATDPPDGHGLLHEAEHE